MESASVITYAGDLNLFEDLENLLVKAIAKEPTEWKRPYGRAIKSVHLNASFVPFSKDCIPKSGSLKLIAQPILHTFWTQCGEVETYKNTVKSDIELWMKQIDGGDWMIISVEVYDIRKSNKLLPRTTVLDKIRADFAVKQADRVVALIHPIKSESKSAESWRSLVNRMRFLILSAYNKTLSAYEETIRSHRECRPQPNWSYCAYFTMQEEMALVLEMLGLHEEALVQYDELDALFTQFVLNSTKGEHPKWLSSFTVPLQKWSGPSLGQRVTPSQRDLLRCSKLDLLQFRSYLFGRQCSLLVKLNKPAEMAQRAVAFVHSCVQEMKILEVSAPAGALATWGFLVCLEILHACEKFTDSKHVQAYSVYTAGLWAYARNMLKQLGTLCGLTSPSGPTSEQLHTIVGLTSGMGDPPGDSLDCNPIERLKEALSSKESYKRYFLELSELAISTYKHIGRMRFARLMGIDLAEQYLTMEEPDKAATFLNAALQGAQDDQWTAIALETQLKLVQCYSSTAPDIKYTKCCLAIAASNSDDSTRRAYYAKFLQSLKLLAQERPMVTSLGELGTITRILVDPRHQIRRGQCVVRATLEFFSNLPENLKCNAIKISIERGTTESSQKVDEGTQEVFKKLPMFELVDYKQDGSLNAANIVCREPQKALRRTDSQSRGRKTSNPLRKDFSQCLAAKKLVISPGDNIFTLEWPAQNCGRYLATQMSIELNGLEFLDSVPCPVPEFVVEEVKSQVETKVVENELLAGIPQRIDLILNTGSYFIVEGAPLEVSCSSGLKVSSGNSDWESVMEISLPEMEPFKRMILPVTVFAELPAQSDGDAAMVHTIKVVCNWCGGSSSITLTFLIPLRSVMKLHTVEESKFLQVIMSGQTTHRLILKTPQLTSNAIKLRDENSRAGQPMIISANLKGSFMWELDMLTLPPDCESVPLTFTVEYAAIGRGTEEPQFFTYKCHFGIVNFKTLFVVKCSMEAGKDSEFCRIGTICQLHVNIRRSESGKCAFGTAIMYEICADQALWAVCGRAAGVLTFEQEKYQTVMLELIPHAQGFLPLPQIRLSRYIPAFDKESGRGEDSKPRLEPFSPGQVYCASKSEQVHVLPAGLLD